MGDSATGDAARRLILIRRRRLARRNRLSRLRRAGLRRLVFPALCSAVLAVYGTFWARALVVQLVGSIPASLLLPIAAASCVAAGVAVSSFASAQDRAALDAAFLTVLPWSDAEKRTAFRLSLLLRLAVGSLVVGVGLRLAAGAAGLSDVVIDATVGTILYGAGFAIGTAGEALAYGRHVGPRHASAGAKMVPDPRWLVWLDRAAPRWAGRWALAPRWRLIVLLAIGALAGNFSIAVAASRATPPASTAPGLAMIGSLIVLIGAARCAPLVSPVLRASPISYHRAALAMFRLPASLACGWLAVFTAAVLGLGLASPRAMATAGGASLLLGLGYALTALSVPTSSRLASAFYLIALGLAADQYAGLQNLAFVALFGVLSILVLLARGRFRGGR